MRGEVAAAVSAFWHVLLGSRPSLHCLSIPDEMEAVAAFGLAANILQVVEFAYKILSTGDQIYQAGSTLQNSELEVAVRDFTVLNSRLKSWVRPGSDFLGSLEEEGQVCTMHNRDARFLNICVQSLDSLSRESERIAQELLSVLLSLRIDEHASKYKSFLHAIRTTWNTKKIMQIKQRLDEIRNELHFHIQIMMKVDRADMKTDILQTLDEASRHVLTEQGRYYPTTAS
jgi:hypothetical protein